MGRGNACVYNDYEGLYYVGWDNFSYQYEDEDGNVIDDYDSQRFEWEASLALFIKDFMKECKSFKKCDYWLNSEEKAVLESPLFYIAVEDTGWSMAIKLLQKEQDCYTQGNYNNLQGRFYQSYLDKMKECLFNQFDELGVYGGAWTHGIIKKST